MGKVLNCLQEAGFLSPSLSIQQRAFILSFAVSLKQSNSEWGNLKTSSFLCFSKKCFAQNPILVSSLLLI